MSTGTRLSFLDNEDRIHRISVSKFNRFYLRKDENESFPEFAGQRIRYALIFVQLEGRKAVGVKYVDYGVITFNDEGKLDEEVYWRGRHLAANILSIYWPNKENEGVIDATGRICPETTPAGISMDAHTSNRKGAGACDFRH